MHEIDFVITWVDGNDAVWQEEKRKYGKLDTSDDTVGRYRNWEILKYWFRAVEENAPWVRKIHFITYGHLPDFLNVSHPKLHIVNHKDYIPDKYLPTFSSHPIELNMHRIPGLAEQFVYFNDDMFVSAKVYPKDFFQNGKPCYEALEALVRTTEASEHFGHIMLNNIAVINTHFNRREVYRKHFWKWFAPCYGVEVIRNICLQPWPFFQSFKNSHVAMPLLKSTMEEVWNAEYELMDRTCMHKFRDIQDVNPYIFRYWDMVKGNFKPYKVEGKAFHLSRTTIEEVEKGIRSHKNKLICINDGGDISNVEEYMTRITMAFEEKYPRKSSFEK